MDAQPQVAKPDIKAGLQAVDATPPLPYTREAVGQQIQDVQKKMQGIEAGATESLSALKPAAMPNTEFHPLPHKESSELFSLMMILGALGGRSTNQPMVTAMSNMTGIMRGQKEKNDDMIAEQKDQFQINFNAGLAKFKAYNDEKKTILEKYHYDMNASQNELNTLKLMYGVDDKIHTAAETATHHRAMENAKKKAADLKLTGAPGAQLDDKTTKWMAKQYWSGDKSVLTNLGRGVQGAQNVVKLRKAIQEEGEAMGKTPQDLAISMAEFQGLTASERATGTRLAAITVAATEAEKVMPIARKASAEFGRTEFPGVNKAYQSFEAGTGDEKISRFVAANNAVINTYARAISPSGTPTVSDKDHAREVLNTAQTQKQYDAVLNVLQQEIDAALSSPKEVKETLRTNLGGTPSGATSPHQNSKGWTLHTDKNGNQAYVSPDGKQFEEVK